METVSAKTTLKRCQLSKYQTANADCISAKQQYPLHLINIACVNDIRFKVI